MIYHHVLYHGYILSIKCGNHLFKFVLRTERAVLLEPPYRVVAHTLAITKGITETTLWYPNRIETLADNIGL